MNSSSFFLARTALRLTLVGALALLAAGGLHQIGSAQSLSPQDSSYLASIKSDTSKLRQATIQYRGQPIAAQAQNLLGLFFFSRHLTNNAQQEYSTTYREYPSTPQASEAASKLGTLSYWSSNFSAAKPYFQAYLASKPSGAEADWGSYYLVRAMFYTKDSSYMNAVAAYLATPHDSTSSKDVLVHYDIVRYQGTAGNYAQAIAEARKLIANYPNTPYVNFAQMRIANYYTESGNPQSAVSWCDSVLTGYSRSSNEAADIQYLLGTFCIETGDFDKARSTFGILSSSHSGTANLVNAAQYGIASADLAQGYKERDTSLRKQGFTELLAFTANHAKDKNVPGALMRIAVFQSEKMRYTDALASLSRIIAFDSTLIDTIKYASFGDEMKAFRALVLEAHERRGTILRLQMHDPAKALLDINAALAMNPNVPHCIYDKAMCLIDTGDKSDAKVILTQLASGQTPFKEIAASILRTL